MPRHRCLRDHRAVAALEFAITCPVLLLFLGGVADLGSAIYDRGRLAHAVSAGAEYALLTGPTVTASNIRSFVAGLSGMTLGANNPDVAVGTYCLQGTPPTLVASASTCSDGSSPGTYAVITATYTAPLIIPLGSISTGFSLQESVKVQLQ